MGAEWATHNMEIWILRGDLGLHEDEDENQQCRNGGSEHHP